MEENIPLFFNKKENTSNCKHATLAECKKKRCWYLENLSNHCFHALHDKGEHCKCKGEFLVGYTSQRGAAIYTECECLCHKDRYVSPFSRRWS